MIKCAPFWDYLKEKFLTIKADFRGRGDYDFGAILRDFARLCKKRKPV